MLNLLHQLGHKALLQLDPETAHDLSLKALSRAPCLLPRLEPALNPVSLMGLMFHNRLGLAAGLDKNAVALQAFDRLGFSHIEVGTVTPRPQAGNPKPRLFRLPEEHAIINRMGFNNQGVAALVERVKASKSALRAIVGINIGKNKDTPNEEAIADYQSAFRQAVEIADYITVNISSPNTQNLRALQEGQALRDLLAALKQEQKEAKRFVPLVVKIAPDQEPSALSALWDSIGESGVEGLIVSNTTIDKTRVAHLRHGSQEGGLSGKPLTARSTALLQQARSALPNIALIGAGGTMSADDYRAKLDAGADLVQVYTGFVYRGVDLIRECFASKA